jgi:hypothetical protein
MIHFVNNDGGRAEAGYKGGTGDCVCRSIAIASGLSYGEVYKSLNELSKANESGRKRSSARTGVITSKAWFKKYMKSLGFEWVATSGVGKGCRAHLDETELPKGRLVVSVRKHFTAVIDGELHDTHDCSKTSWVDSDGVSHEGVRAVYGYWKLTGDMQEANPPAPKPNKKVVTPKQKVVAIAEELGIQVDGCGYEIEIWAPDGYHFGSTGTHVANCDGWADALRHIRFGLEQCDADTCDLWLDGEGRCDNDTRKKSAA